MQVKQILKERYKLIRKIGQNAGRQTWLATDLKTSPPEAVIVKLLAFNPQMQWDELKLFEREAQVLKNLNHPRIPKYRDYFSVEATQDSGLPWFGLVQEYIKGDSLQQLLDQDKHFTEQQIRYFAEDILKILINLHELSPPVLHRDIKPSNLILGKNNQIYLVDFGAVQDRAKAEGATFTVVGTSGYAPPEQLWGKALPASDLYALGATLIHLLTGTNPSELPQHRMRIKFRDKVSINPDFANWIEQLIQPAPEKRFTTARQALSALQIPLIPHARIEPVQASVSSTSESDTGYGCGWVTFIGGVCVFGLTSLTLLPLLDSSTKSKQTEAKMNISTLNRFQQVYFLERNKLTDSFTDLGVGIKTKTENYSYSIRATDKAVFNYALSRKKNIKSYVGGVFAVPAIHFNPNADKKEMTAVAIHCEALRPGITKPAEPTYQKGKLFCGEGTRDLAKLPAIYR